MKKGYWVVAYRAILDATSLQNYGKIAGPVIQAHGGKFLVRTADAIHAFEAGLKQRTVLVEFESFEKAVSAYQSEEYQAALVVLANGAERDFRIVEGVE